MSKIVIVLMVAAFTLLLLGQANSQQESVNDMKRDLEKRLGATETSVKLELRRLNDEFQSTRNFIKDTYASRLQTVQVEIAIAMGLIAIIGFVAGIAGLRTISRLKTDYASELADVKKLRKKLRQDIKSVTDEYDKLREKNQSQDRRLDEFKAILDEFEAILEVDTLCTLGNFTEALMAAERALTRYPESAGVWFRKGAAHLRLLQYDEAFQAFQRTLEIRPGDQRAVVNLLELALFKEDIDAYEQLLQGFPEPIHKFDEDQHNRFLAYLQVLKSYLLNDKLAMEGQIKTTLQCLGPDEKLERMYWQFGELHAFLAGRPGAPEKNLLLKFVQVISGSQAPRSLFPELYQAEQAEPAAPGNSGDTTPILPA